MKYKFVTKNNLLGTIRYENNVEDLCGMIADNIVNGDLLTDIKGKSASEVESYLLNLAVKYSE